MKDILKPGDEIIISNLEHHANIVPWQMMCERKGAVLKVIPVNDNGEIILDEYHETALRQNKIVAVTQASNALGTILPVKEIIEAAHSMNIPVLIDGAQGIQHGIVDVNFDWIVIFMFSPDIRFTDQQVSVSSMARKNGFQNCLHIRVVAIWSIRVTFEKTTYNELPFKFEAGTMNYAGAIGLGKGSGLCQ